MASTTVNDEKLTLKKLENHFIKTVVGAFALAVIAGFFSSYAFFYKTTDNLEELNKNKLEQKQEVKELQVGVDGIKKDVSDIKSALSNTDIYTNYNKENIKTLQSEITDIKKSQEEMLKLLYEIKIRK
jgi:peptidoglycan hydrolase CwlO-like protein